LAKKPFIRYALDYPQQPGLMFLADGGGTYMFATPLDGPFAGKIMSESSDDML